MTSKSKALIVVAILVAFGVLAFFISSESTDEITTDASTNTSSASPEDMATDQQQPEQPQSFKSAEVALHNTESDCWTTVNSSVYDITSYVPRHPGGDEILLACGTDGTDLFTQRKTNEGEDVGSGTPHSKNAANQLASFKIGVLIQ